MLKLSIKKNNSKNFLQAINILINLGGFYDNKTGVLILNNKDLLEAYPALMRFFSIAGKWSGLTAEYNKNPVDAYKFIHTVFNTVARCAIEKREYKYSYHCWQDIDNKGWGCKHITALSIINSGSGDYEKSGKYWYNYGRFNDFGEWVIDKQFIYNKVKDQAEKRGLMACPFFDIKAIKRKVFIDLPDVIIPDNYLYRIHYAESFREGRRVYTAVNIRHIADISDAPGLMSAKLRYKIKSATDFFSANPGKISERLKGLLSEDVRQFNEKDLLNMLDAFDKYGICKN